MSEKERDRLKVLHEVMQGHLLQREAAEHLGLSERWIRERIRRLRASGDQSLIHGLRGRVSNRGLKSEERAQLLSLYREHYTDFGPTLAKLLGLIDSLERTLKGSLGSGWLVLFKKAHHIVAT